MIFDKPFNFSEMLRRTIFLGRPNFFNAKDFNKELLTLHTFIEEFNKHFAVYSDIQFQITNFVESPNIFTNNTVRNLTIQWADTTVLYKGVKFTIPASGIVGYTQTFPTPQTNTSPRPVRPVTYIVLTADLETLTYADNPELCGIQADEFPNSAPSVNVEQYQNIQIKAVANPANLNNVIAVLGTLHPRYDEIGADIGTGFLYHCFRNNNVTIKNGANRATTTIQSNNSLFEYMMENITMNMNRVLNERQLIRRFNLADLENFEKARHNLGLSNIVNRRQLVQAENLRDLTDKPRARQNLGLGGAATLNVGTGATDVAPGNIIAIGMMMMWPKPINEIPAGWVLCDGQNGTFDMRGYVPVGQNTGDTNFNEIGKTGGSKSFTLLPDHLPPHDHSYAFAQGSNGAIGSNYKNSGISSVEAFENLSEMEEEVDPDGQRLRGYTARTGKSTAVGQGTTATPITTLSPYRVLNFIMYMGTTIAPPTPLEAVPALTYPNFSTPTTVPMANPTDGGYGSYIPKPIGESGTTIGGGVTLTNPE